MLRCLTHSVPGPGSPRALPTIRRCEGSQSSRWEQRPRTANIFCWPYWIYCIADTYCTIYYILSYHTIFDTILCFSTLYHIILAVHYLIVSIRLYHVVCYYTIVLLHNIALDYIISIYHILWHCCILYCMNTYYMLYDIKIWNHIMLIHIMVLTLYYITISYCIALGYIVLYTILLFSLNNCIKLHHLMI